jgi:hypothetical protein
MRGTRWITSLLILFSSPVGFSAPAWSHQVWAHGTCVNPADTVEFFHKSREIYAALTRLEQIWQESSFSLENGILAEFDSKLDKTKGLQVDQYRTALSGYVQMRASMENLDGAIQGLSAVNAKCERIDIFDKTLDRNLSEAGNFLRLSRTGVRFADAAGVPAEKISPMHSIDDILYAWRSDLTILETTLDQVIAAMKDAMPLAERGEFAAVMLSGRNAFGEKMPQFTDMFSAYQRLYVTAVLATITTTMQVYPNGYQWLTAK